MTPGQVSLARAVAQALRRGARASDGTHSPSSLVRARTPPYPPGRALKRRQSGFRSCARASANARNRRRDSQPGGRIGLVGGERKTGWRAPLGGGPTDAPGRTDPRLLRPGGRGRRFCAFGGQRAADYGPASGPGQP